MDHAPSRGRGRPPVERRERIAPAARLRIPFAELLARKAEREQRAISEREVRAVTGLYHQRIKALQRGESTAVDLGTLEVLLHFFDCTLDELVVDSARDEPRRHHRAGGVPTQSASDGSTDRG